MGKAADGGSDRAAGKRASVTIAAETVDGDTRLRPHGEFDLYNLAALHAAIGAAIDTGRFTSVDLSGVVFLDVVCFRELVSWQLLRPDIVKLVDPSWQVLATATACGLEERLGRPRHGTDSRGIPNP
jgi:anti-anti-sigma regulatory factor